MAALSSTTRGADPKSNRRLLALIGCTFTAAMVGTAAWSYTDVARDELYSLYPAHTATTPVSTRGVAILVSDDTGLRQSRSGLIAEQLAHSGASVIGINAPNFFATRRSPGEVEHLIEDGLARANEIAPGRPVALIGDAFGADVLHVGLARLPLALRKRVGLVVLITPDDAVHYRISLAELTGLRKPDSDAFTTASRLSWTPTYCIAQTATGDGLCPHLKLHNVRQMMLPSVTAATVEATITGALRSLHSA